MHLSRHHKPALCGAVVTSGLALADAVTRALTGHPSVFAEGSDVRAAQVFSALAHGLTYLALAWVLVREADRIRAAGRAAGVLRWVLLASLVLLACGFLLFAPLLESPDRAGAAGVVFGVLMTAGFVGLILGSLVFGPLLLRAPGLRTGARVLTALAPVLGLTILLGVVAGDWAHPAYLETTLHFGIALLGAGAVHHAGSGAVSAGSSTAQSAGAR